MCGIAGFVTAGFTNNQNQPPSRELVRRMCDRLAHRGPDGSGVYADQWAALGHRRLSIIDVTGGSQPLANEDESVWVVFNGEIYNHAELRRELESKGHRFHTRSDTEVLVHLWEERGERMAESLDGMFAFAIWDSPRRKLFLARDRFGKKPLYYTDGAWKGGPVAFASELKAFEELPGFAPRTSVEAVADFLSLGYVPDPRSIYRGVSKLAPASWLCWEPSRGLTKPVRYWEPGFVPEGGGGAPDWRESVERIRTMTTAAVKRRLMSDVPLGAFLSGGLDSSVVVGAMTETGAEVKTFSIGFTNPRFDELTHARLVAQRHRTSHHEETVTPSIEEMCGTLVEHFDEPFGDSSAIPMLYLSRMTRRHVTVALSGDGGDEIFGGYERYLLGLAHARATGILPHWARRPLFGAAAALYPGKLEILPRVLRWKPILDMLSRDFAGAYFTLVSAFGDGELHRLLSEEMRWKLGGYSTRQWFASLFDEASHLPPLEQMQSVDLKTYLPGRILVKVDRATMAYSLEARAPLLDHHLAEAAARLPSAWKARGWTGKRILRSSFEDVLAPQTAGRAKQGFSVPMAEWLRTSLRPAFEHAALDPGMEEWVSPGQVRRLWDEHRGGSRNHAGKLWNLLVLGWWRQRHLLGRPHHEIAREIAQAR